MRTSSRRAFAIRLSKETGKKIWLSVGGESLVYCQDGVHDLRHRPFEKAGRSPDVFADNPPRVPPPTADVAAAEAAPAVGVGDYDNFGGGFGFPFEGEDFEFGFDASCDFFAEQSTVF
jgi:hypothetical protein